MHSMWLGARFLAESALSQLLSYLLHCYVLCQSFDSWACFLLRLLLETPGVLHIKSFK